MLTNYTIRFSFILVALCSANSLAQPIITSGTGTITPDANGGFIIDCPTVCTLAPDSANPLQTSTLNGSFNLNSNGQIALSPPISNQGSVIYSSIPTTIIGAPATIGGQTNFGSLTGTNAGSITVSGNPNLTGGTLVINNAGTLTTTGTFHAGAVTITSNGNIAVLDGSSLTLTGIPNAIVQIGLSGPMLPAENITSDAKEFSVWLNNNGLVTTSQIGSIGSLVSSGQNFVLFGSHHRILLDNGIEKEGIGVWATGDYARHDPSQTNASIGELGIYKDAGNFRLGIGAGMNQAVQTLPLNGSGKLVARYFVLEGDYRSTSFGWIVSTTLFLGSNKADISRGYLVGTTSDISIGKPKGASWAARIRGDWSNVIAILGMNVSPYFSYTHAESRLDAYSETGGTLPLSFAQQKQSSDEVRAGATTITKLAEQTDLRFPLELVYRKNDSVTITGSTIGLPFSFNTPSKNQSWARAGIELDHHLSAQSIFNAAALFASQGGDSSWLATLGLKHVF